MDNACRRQFFTAKFSNFVHFGEESGCFAGALDGIWRNLQMNSSSGNLPLLCCNLE
jgi:hypothetical protein